MREIEFRCWNDIDKMMIEWGTLRASPILLMNVIKGIVKHHTLEQYTGLKDYNGVKIFEGDKLKCLGYEGVVVYDSEEPRFAIKPDDCSDTFALIKYEMQNFEIIGNIHEAQS